MPRKPSTRSMDAPKRKGRPALPGGRERFSTTLPPHIKRWLQRRGNASQAIIELVEAAIERGQGRS